MKEIELNVLVLGKSGAGKSSLLNYIFGEFVEKTGSGAAVTSKGVYKHVLELDNKLKINMYDTWGLEAKKESEWWKLIKSTLDEHIGCRFSDIKEIQSDLFKYKWILKHSVYNYYIYEFLKKDKKSLEKYLNEKVFEYCRLKDYEEFEELKIYAKRIIKAYTSVNINDWIHMIVYCINANSARIEDYEMNTIQKLTDMGYTVIVVFTHCDCEGTEEHIISMKNYLVQNGIDTENIICVCNEEKKLIGGRKTERFGREELLKRFQITLWDTIINNVPEYIYNKSYGFIEDAVNNCKSYAREKINFFNKHSDKKYGEINKHCGEILNNCQLVYNSWYINGINEAKEYYLELFDTIKIEVYNRHEFAMDFESLCLNYSMDFYDKLGDNVAATILFLIPVVGLTIPWVSTGVVEDRYCEYIDDIAKKIKNKNLKYRDFVKQYLNSLLV